MCGCVGQGPDSSFLFGSLLDADQGGAFSIQPADSPAVKGHQVYIRNTNVLKTSFHTPTGDFDVIDFAPRWMRTPNQSLRPPTLIRIVRPVSGTNRVICELQPRADYGRAAFESNWVEGGMLLSSKDMNLRFATNAPYESIAEKRPLTLDRPLYFYLTMSRELPRDLPRTCESYLQLTVAYWETWVKHCHLPREYQEQVVRSALVLKLHQFEDTGAVIAATTTSIPEAPGTERCWDYRYCWLRDAHFALDALRNLGHFEEMEMFVQYLRNLAEDRIAIRCNPFMVSVALRF